MSLSLSSTDSDPTAIIEAVHDELDTDSSPEARPRRTRKRSAAEKVRAKQFPQAMRGYDRLAVDAWRDEIAELVTRLEEQEPRDSAVRHAIDELGRETSSILQRAHESAGDIEARSRAQADERLERADQEAEITIREAEERAERLEGDTRAVWDQRTRLLEEMRQLADEVLGVADDALERMGSVGGQRLELGGETDERHLLDTVEDEPTLETDDDSGEYDTGEYDVSDQTRVLQIPGETQPFDAGSATEDPQEDDPLEDPVEEESPDRH